MATSTKTRISSSSARNANNLPAAIIVDNILPFLDRHTYDNCVLANKEVWEMSQAASTPPWPGKITLLKIENAGVSCVAFSSCGEAVACGCDNGAVCIWGKSGRRVDLKSHPSPISSIAFSPTGDVLVAGCDSGFIRVWSLVGLVPDGSEGTAIRAHEASIHSLDFAPNTNILVSAGREISVCIWDLSTKRLVSRIPHPEKLESVAVSPSGDFVASATWEGTVRVFKVTDEYKLDRMTTLGKALPLSKVQFSRDGKSLFALRGFRLRQFDMTNGSIQYMSGSRVHRVFSVTVSPDGRVVAYGDRDGTIRTSICADALSKARFKDTFYGHHHECSLRFSPNGKTLASGSADGTFRLWNV